MYIHIHMYLHGLIIPKKQRAQGPYRPSPQPPGGRAQGQAIATQAPGFSQQRPAGAGEPGRAGHGLGPRFGSRSFRLQISI